LLSYLIVCDFYESILNNLPWTKNPFVDKLLKELQEIQKETLRPTADLHFLQNNANYITEQIKGAREDKSKHQQNLEKDEAEERAQKEPPVYYPKGATENYLARKLKLGLDQVPPKAKFGICKIGHKVTITDTAAVYHSRNGTVTDISANRVYLTTDDSVDTWRAPKNLHHT
jgi:hypothetical protein